MRVFSVCDVFACMWNFRSIVILEPYCVIYVLFKMVMEILYGNQSLMVHCIDMCNISFFFAKFANAYRFTFFNCFASLNSVYVWICMMILIEITILLLTIPVFHSSWNLSNENILQWNSVEAFLWSIPNI